MEPSIRSLPVARRRPPNTNANRFFTTRDRVVNRTLMFEVYPGYNTTPMTELAMQHPMLSHGVAFALDWDNDGVLDLWHHNHYWFSTNLSRWSDPSTQRRGPERAAPGGCMVDWDAVLQDAENPGTYHAANGGNGFIEWSDVDTYSWCFDVHSTVFLDLDGDGFRDLFMTTGSGDGLGKSPKYDNILFWGEPSNNELGYRLVGGRDAALAAGLDGRDSTGETKERNRVSYWLDVDGDGLLDFFYLNHARKDDSVLPGNLYRNMGGRKFKRVIPGDIGFSEFTFEAVLTDIDGDGWAREIVVPSHCKADNPFCDGADRPKVGDTSIYRRDSQAPYLICESLNPGFHRDWVYAIGTGDFNFDNRADVAILWRKRITFYYSSSRMRRCEGISDSVQLRTCLHTLGEPDHVLELTTCDSARSMRFADFDLDGKIDMLLVCKYPGKHAIYELKSSGIWKEMVRDLGVLNAEDMMMGGKHFCKNVPIVEQGLIDRIKRCTEYFSEDECKDVLYHHQFVICNWRAESPEEPGAKGIGATVADLDNDGYPDVIMGYREGSMLMFRNILGDNQPRNNYFAVRLDTKAGPAASIGAIVTLTAMRMGPGDNETHTQLRVLSSLVHETDFNGGHEDRLVFGLGREGLPWKLVVHWPNCCNKAVFSEEASLWKWKNSIDKPYLVPYPEVCYTSCFS